MAIEHLSEREFVERCRDPLVDQGPDHPTRSVVAVALDGSAGSVGPFGPFGLPAVVVGLTRGTEAGPVADACDVVLGPAEHDGLELVARGVEANPVAALTLVTLLRRSAGLDVAAGLLMESACYGALQAGQEFARWRRRTPRRTSASSSPPDRRRVVAERDGAHLHLTLCRPERRNALDATMRDALAEQLALVQLDPTIEQVTLDGEGPAFCSGGDLDEFGTASDVAVAHLTRLERSLAALVHAVADRITVRLHGTCIGSGIELAAFAGRVVADASVSIGLPEVSMGLIPGAGGTVGIARRIGRPRLCRLALTGDRIDGPTALRWGLVDELV
jgi:hypothetical protein